MSEKLYLSLDSKKLSEKISKAQESVCYVAPGILLEVAEAIVKVSQRIGTESITVCLDLNEEVFRMGYGTMSAMKKLEESQIKLNSASGLRAGIIIIDDTGYMFTPTALLLEADQPSDAPNAMRLFESQVKEVRIRTSEKEKEIVAQKAETEKEREQIRRQELEVETEEVQKSEICEIEENLKKNPPLKFDLQRQVRVFNTYLQYVEISFSGVRIQRRRIPIPQDLFSANTTRELNDKLRTTFDLIEKDKLYQLNDLEKNLKVIKKKFTCSIDKKSRVILKENKPEFEEEINEIREKLIEYKEKLEQELDTELKESKQQILDHCVSILKANPTKEMACCVPTEYKEDAIELWVESKLLGTFPKANELCQKMNLEVVYKDTTFETLNDEEFIRKIKKGFPNHDWDKRLYDDYLAVKEKKISESKEV